MIGRVLDPNQDSLDPLELLYFSLKQGSWCPSCRVARCRTPCRPRLPTLVHIGGRYSNLTLYLRLSSPVPLLHSYPSSSSAPLIVLAFSFCLVSRQPNCSLEIGRSSGNSLTQRLGDMAKRKLPAIRCNLRHDRPILFAKGEVETPPSDFASCLAWLWLVCYIAHWHPPLPARHDLDLDSILVSVK